MKEKQKLILRASGGLVILLAFILAWHWYDWKLAVVILIFLFGNNWERSANK